MEKTRLRSTVKTLETIACRRDDEIIYLVIAGIIPSLGRCLSDITRNFDEPVAIVDQTLRVALSDQGFENYVDNPDDARLRLITGSAEDLFQIFTDDDDDNPVFAIVFTTSDNEDDWKTEQEDADATNYEFWQCIQLIPYYENEGNENIINIDDDDDDEANETLDLFIVEREEDGNSALYTDEREEGNNSDLVIVEREEDKNSALFTDERDNDNDPDVLYIEEMEGNNSHRGENSDVSIPDTIINEGNNFVLNDEELDALLNNSFDDEDDD